MEPTLSKQTLKSEQISAALKQQLFDLDVKITGSTQPQLLQKETKIPGPKPTGTYKRPDYLLRLL